MRTATIALLIALSSCSPEPEVTLTVTSARFDLVAAIEGQVANVGKVPARVTVCLGSADRNRPESGCQCASPPYEGVLPTGQTERFAWTGLYLEEDRAPNVCAVPMRD